MRSDIEQWRLKSSNKYHQLYTYKCYWTAIDGDVQRAVTLDIPNKSVLNRPCSHYATVLRFVFDIGLIFPRLDMTWGSMALNLIKGNVDVMDYSRTIHHDIRYNLRILLFNKLTRMVAEKQPGWFDICYSRLVQKLYICILCWQMYVILCWLKLSWRKNAKWPLTEIYVVSIRARNTNVLVTSQVYAYI